MPHAWSRFNTWVTPMVQDMGNTSAANLLRAVDAMERTKGDESTNGVCVASSADRELSRFVSGVWDQSQDRLQVEGTLSGAWIEWMAEQSRRPRSSPSGLD